MSRELGKRVRRASTAGGLLAGTAAAAMVLCLATPQQAAAQERAASGATAKAGAADPELSGAPDPLTPPKADEPAPAAPGAGQRTAPVSVAAETDPIVIEARRLTGELGNRTAGAAQDRAAVAAFYAEGTPAPIWTSRDGLSARGRAVVEEIGRAADWGLDPAAFDLGAAPASGASTSELAAAEVRISQAVLTYARHARGGRIDPTSLSANIDMRPRIFEPRTVLDGLSGVEDAGGYLRGLHPRHEGFQRLRQALLDLRSGDRKAPVENASAPVAEADEPAGKKGSKSAGKAKPAPKLSRSETEQRIIVNMERWRWMPDELGAFHVFDNVPEQVTRVVRDGKVVLTEKIVVGKPVTPTPLFSANMRFVIFHPTWGVPDGIKTNELGPILRRASSKGGWFFGDNDGASRALARHDLRVVHRGREVNPDSVDWSNVDIRQFSFVQPASSKNVLGVVKFRFPNKYDVYMHDTPERHLFNQSSRAYSHGCMRVQNPMRLAEVLLAHDKGWSADKVQSFVGRGTTSDITLDKPIPVHITYFTASVDDQGALKLHGDLYGMDSRVASALAGRSVHLASAKGAEPAPPKREARRTPEPKKSSTTARSSEPFNPFSGLYAN
jgi:murein L,D-transpeptidase YcbB/YkuD